MTKFNSDNHAIVELIDVIRDLNKSVSLLIENSELRKSVVADAAMDVAQQISNDLGDLTEHFDNVE